MHVGPSLQDARAPRSMLPPSVLPDISPTGGEIGRHRGFRKSLTLQDEHRHRSCQSPPLVGRGIAYEIFGLKLV